MPFSRRRETYLVTYLENEVAAELIKTQALLAAHLMPIPLKGRNLVKETFDIYKSYSQILLPILKKEVNIKDIPKQERINISDTLAKLKTQLIKHKK